MIEDLIKDRDTLKANEDELKSLLEKISKAPYKSSSYGKVSAKLQQPQPKLSFWRTTNYGYGGPMKVYEFTPRQMLLLEQFIASQLESVKTLRKEKDAKIEAIEELVKAANP